MSEHVTETEKPCVRGCTIARRHAEECEDRDTCAGCLPRPAQHGRLCLGCHRRLVNLIDNIPGQHDLLRAFIQKAGTSGPQQLETEARITTQWRTDSSAPYPSGLYAKGYVGAPQESEPLRSACIDSARALTDWLAVVIDDLIEATGASGPTRLYTQAAEHGLKRVRWSAVLDRYVADDVPPAYEVHDAARWLGAQIGRLEAQEWVGDVWEEIAEHMSQAHSLAPWRTQVSSLDGIECPECHRMALVHFGGDDFVSCTACKAVVEWGRYWIWVRELEARRTA